MTLCKKLVPIDDIYSRLLESRVVLYFFLGYGDWKSPAAHEIVLTYSCARLRVSFYSAQWGEFCKFCTRLPLRSTANTRDFEIFAVSKSPRQTGRAWIKATDIIEEVDSLNRIKARVKSSLNWGGGCPCGYATRYCPAAFARARKKKGGRKERELTDGNGTRNSALRRSPGIRALNFAYEKSRFSESVRRKRGVKPSCRSVVRSPALSRSTSHEPEVTVYVFSMVYNSFDSCLARVLHTTN